MSSKTDEIIARNAKPVVTNEYRSYLDSGGRPQMGFVVTLANGELHGFQYHTLDNTSCMPEGDYDVLRFTHRAKGVTISGHGLGVILRAIVRQHLVEIVEPDGRPAAPDMPVIVHIDISEKQLPSKTEPAVRLAKSA